MTPFWQSKPPIYLGRARRESLHAQAPHRAGDGLVSGHRVNLLERYDYPWKDVPWKLKVPGNGNRRARETPVAPWAGQLLRQWITTRAEIGLPSSPHLDAKGEPQGPFLFPGRGGQLWAKMSHYEAVKQVMEASGVDDPQSGSGGAFRLRHTFALRQLRRKRSVEEVARWMGIANLEEMDRYRVVLDAYEEAV